MSLDSLSLFLNGLLETAKNKQATRVKGRENPADGNQSRLKRTTIPGLGTKSLKGVSNLIGKEENDFKSSMWGEIFQQRHD